jgi:hypothetical protein
MKWMACALFLALPAFAAAADDVTGAWTFTGDVQGIAVLESCTFTVADTALTGSCTTESGKYDVKGKVDGKTVTFHHAGKYNGDDYVITYTGKLNSDGAMTGTMDVDPFAVSGSFSAKKGAAAPAAQ